MPRGVFAALLVGLVALPAWGIFLGNPRLVAVAVLLFGFPAAGLLATRMRTRIYDDRIEQGRLVMSTLRFEDVAHVFEKNAARDPYIAMSATSAGLDAVLIVGKKGPRVTLSAIELPRERLVQTVQKALDGALRNARTTVAAGGTYMDPHGLTGIGGDTVHGHHIGLTVSKSSCPISEIASLDSNGTVRTKEGKSFSIGTSNLVLWALLHERGVV
jgi:hypothetical protein